ncbi:hypothetical protein AAEX28_09980 [Lentisphaerota bacterium WC36G]|nr:hypothetical protein LJT99_12815 [Lentisphaerae bacterium WC36]
MVDGFKRFGLLVLIGVTLMSANFVQAKRLSAQEIKEKILIIPIDKSYQKYSGKIMPRKLQAFKDEKLRAVAAKKSFVNWKTFEDEFISFSYPDHPDIKLEIKQQGKKESDNNFSRDYFLKIGDNIYYKMALKRAEDYRPNYCLCGPIFHHVFLVNKKTLLRFSLLRSGDAKTVQIFSNGWRLETFEWTHLPVHQDIFLEITSSMKLKKSATLSEAVVFAKKTYNRAGFLNKDMSKEQVIEILGKPIVTKGNLFTFQYPSGRRLVTAEIVFDKKGIFHGLKKNCYDYVLTKPEKGSFEWIEEKITTEFSDAERNYEPTPLTENDAKLIFKIFVKKIATAEFYNKMILYKAICFLAKNGFQDQRILKMVEEKCQQKIVSRDDISIITYYAPENKEQLLSSQLRKIYKSGNKTQKAKYPDGRNEVAAIVLSMKQDEPLTKQLIIEGLNNKNKNIRGALYELLYLLPIEEAVIYLRKGFNEKEELAKFYCEEAIRKMKLSDIEKVIDKETNIKLKEAFQYEIDCKDDDSDFTDEPEIDGVFTVD